MRRAVLALVLLTAGCDTTVPPTAPTPTTVPAAAPAPPAAPAGPAANLEITAFTLEAPESSNGWYFYLPKLELKETTGAGGASILSVTYTDPGGNRFNMSGAGCSFPFAVGPGGTWSVSTVYLYCQDVDVTAPIDRLTATIIYSDTSGTTKTVSATSR